MGSSEELTADDFALDAGNGESDGEPGKDSPTES